MRPPRSCTRWTVLVLLLALGGIACGPSLKRFVTERELFGPDFPGEPETKWLQLNPVYNEQVKAAYWDDEREGGLGTVLFVHGIPNNKRTFLYLYRYLEPDWRVVAPDIPGFGFSSKPNLSEAFPPEDVYSCNTLAYFMVDFVECLERQDAERRAAAGLPPAPSAFQHMTIVSNSYGCAGVLAALVETPRFGERVDRIVFISPAVYYQRVLETSRIRRALTNFSLFDPIIRGLRLDDRIAVNSYIRIFYNDFMPNDPQRYRIPREQIEETFRILNEPNIYYVLRAFARNLNPWNYDRLVANFHDITQPTLILVGDHDQIVPNIYPRRLVNDMPNAELHVFENCGHQPHLELPFQTNELISTWLREQVGAPVTASGEALLESTQTVPTLESTNGLNSTE
jgi:pimeloyl-ACP methyl ester carboxylesterase